MKWNDIKLKLKNTLTDLLTSSAPLAPTKKESYLGFITSYKEGTPLGEESYTLAKAALDWEKNKYGKGFTSNLSDDWYDKQKPLFKKQLRNINAAVEAYESTLNAEATAETPAAASHAQIQDGRRQHHSDPTRGQSF